MKIGQFVQNSIPAIFKHCEEDDPSEFVRLQHACYYKKTFDINYPFCRPVDGIGQTDRVRYWSQKYIVNGITVRVTSQWFNPPTSKSLPLFRAYLTKRGIAAPNAVDDEDREDGERGVIVRSARGRYRGNAIGNAQNLLGSGLTTRT